MNPTLRAIVTGLLGGIAGALFGGFAAAILNLSVAIAATVSGVSLASLVALLSYRHPPQRTT